MKRLVLLATIITGLLLGACSGGSQLPEATGKASIIAINAIPRSPAINFLIEERGIGSVAYKASSSSNEYDDLDYIFNFEVFFAGDSQLTRFASQQIDFVADQRYTLVATGTLAAPTLTVWESAERDFAGTETVFEARFAHTSSLLGAIDVYFALDGVAPALGEEVATLSLGEISEPLDFESDEYVIVVTTSGDPTDILYQSAPSLLLPRTNLIITPFDGDENDTAPVVMRGLTTLGGAITFSDLAAPPTVQFLHGARDMGSSDVYDDEALTSQILMDHDYRQLTADMPIVVGDNRFLYTPADDTAIVNVDTTLAVANNGRFRVATVGVDGTYSAVSYILNRRSVDTSARLNVLSTSNNFDFIDLYVVDADTAIDGQAPFRAGLISRSAIPASDILDGSFDIYLTNFTLTDVIAGPIRLDIAKGDVVDMVIFDTDDPAILEIVVF